MSEQHFILSARIVGENSGVVTCTCGWQHTGSLRDCYRMGKAHVGEPVDFPDHKTTETACTNCGHAVNGAMPSDPSHQERPKGGNLSICINCGHLMVFNDDLTVRELTAEEAIEAAGNPELIKASTAIAELKRLRAQEPEKKT